MTKQEGRRPELIIALVCPLGVRVELLQKTICDELKNFGYRCEDIHVSDLLRNFDSEMVEPDASEYSRITVRQSQGFKFRCEGGPEVLARAAIAAIKERRLGISQHPDKPANACAYVLRQLKHPKEIELLRHVYGQSLVVVAGHAPKEMRIKTLANTLARSEGQPSASQFEKWARELIDTDDKEEHPDDEEAKLGQNTRDAYPLADFFANLAHNDPEPVKRFINLLFGHPFHTPTPEEMAMHQANAIALRSSDERRQVGAVIVSRTKRSDSNIMDADILASGMNEVPRREGGFYWEGEFDDARDQALRRSNPENREDLIKSYALKEIVIRLKRNNWLAPEYACLHERELSKKLLPLLKRTQFVDISEFMRQVHAEMAALVDAAKRGVAVRGSEMYVTTFPCHNCAKHIIAAGIKKVVYLEPYAKSRVKELHDEEIALDPADPRAAGDKVLFVPFTGVAPRQYARLFSMSARSHKNGGLALNDWHDKRSTLSPRYVLANAAQAYTRTEREELERLPKAYKWDRAVLCPGAE